MVSKNFTFTPSWEDNPIWQAYLFKSMFQQLSIATKRCWDENHWPASSVCDSKWSPKWRSSTMFKIPRVKPLEPGRNVSLMSQTYSRTYFRKKNMLFPIIRCLFSYPWDWYIHLHLVDFYGKWLGKYTSPMDPMGIPIHPTNWLDETYFMSLKDPGEGIFVGLCPWNKDASK